MVFIVMKMNCCDPEIYFRSFNGQLHCKYDTYT